MLNRVLCCFVFLLTACTGQPDGVTAIKSFDANQYLGTWYEIVRLDHSFERDLENVTATYSLRDDGGIKVISGAHAWNGVEGAAGLRLAGPEMSIDDIGRTEAEIQ